MDIDPTNSMKCLFATAKTKLLLETNIFLINLSFSPFEILFGKRKEKKVLTLLLYLHFSGKKCILHY